jgi:hypothetical protein
VLLQKFSAYMLSQLQAAQQQMPQLQARPDLAVPLAAIIGGFQCYGGLDLATRQCLVKDCGRLLCDMEVSARGGLARDTEAR